MRSLYNILFLIFFAFASPYYFFRLWRRGNWRKGFGQRFGLYDNNLKQAITNRQVVWLHAVSVGEMNVCIELISALEPRVPTPNSWFPQPPPPAWANSREECRPISARSTTLLIAGNLSPARSEPFIPTRSF